MITREGISELSGLIARHKDSISILIQTFAVIVIPLVLVGINNTFSKKSKAEELARGDKKKVFDDFIDSLYILFEYNSKKPEDRDESQWKEYEKRMKDVRKKLITVASLDTIKVFNEWSILARKKAASDEESVIVFDRILYFLRKDVGIEDESPYESLLKKIISISRKIITLEFIHPLISYDRFEFLTAEKYTFKHQSRLITCLTIVFGVPLILILLPIIIPYSIFKTLRSTNASKGDLKK